MASLMSPYTMRFLVRSILGSYCASRFAASPDSEAGSSLASLAEYQMRLFQTKAALDGCRFQDLIRAWRVRLKAELTCQWSCRRMLGLACAAFLLFKPLKVL